MRRRIIANYNAKGAVSLHYMLNGIERYRKRDELDDKIKETKEQS